MTLPQPTTSAAVPPLATMSAPAATVQTHHHPRKKFFNRLQALVTSPKRVVSHAVDSAHARARGLHLHGGDGHDGDGDDSIKGDSLGESTGAARRRAHSTASGSSAASSSAGTTSASSSRSHGDARAGRRSATSSGLTSPNPVYPSSEESSPSSKRSDAGLLRCRNARAAGGQPQFAVQRPEAPAGKAHFTNTAQQKAQTLVRPHLKLRIVTW